MSSRTFSFISSLSACGWTFFFNILATSLADVFSDLAELLPGAFLGAVAFAEVFLVTTFAFAVDFLATGLAFAGADFLAGALVFADLAAGFVFVVDLSVFGVGMESY
jgi:hypothetical protein